MTTPRPQELCLALSLVVVLGSAACDSERPARTESQAGEESTVAPAEEPTSPAAQLAALDPRRPVPLQPMMAWHQKQNMMAHLVAIQGIVAGAADDDWVAVAEASAAIESSPGMAQMCQHMGAGADGFTAAALAFHERADAIGEAARNEDGRAVLAATAATLSACTSCHATYRQEVVGAEAWQALSGQDFAPHDPSAHGGH